MNDKTESLMENYSFHFLADKPEYIEEMANIFYNEWQSTYHAFGLHSLQDVIQDMKDNHACNYNQIPLLLIALDKNSQKLVATAALEKCDVPTNSPYSNTTPWLACVYTKVEHRGKGIATFLVKQLLESAKQLNYTHVWLWTEDAANLYTKIGFHLVEKMKHINLDIMIMRIDFDPSIY